MFILFVYNISGDFQNGKSLLFNFLIRYLEAGGKKGWMEKTKEKSFFKQAASYLYRLVSAVPVTIKPKQF
jgi:hypothetical protein